LAVFAKIACSTHSSRNLTQPETESVLAHEIGHYKKRHVIKLLGFPLLVFLAFAVIAWLATAVFYRAFGFVSAGFSAANWGLHAVVALLADDKFLGLTVDSYFVASFRIRGGFIRACDQWERRSHRSKLCAS